MGNIQLVVILIEAQITHNSKKSDRQVSVVPILTAKMPPSSQLNIYTNKNKYFLKVKHEQLLIFFDNKFRSNWPKERKKICLNLSREKRDQKY